jgi:UDP-N-acetylglucosamine:LPS N-acetylglucosamine transferase
MELAAARRPFLYAPLERHFEQRFHVRHRLERHGAGRMIDYAESTPESIADGVVAAFAGRREPCPGRARSRARRAAHRRPALATTAWWR